MMSMKLGGTPILNIKGADYQKWGHKLNVKYQFDQKHLSITNHETYGHI